MKTLTAPLFVLILWFALTEALKTPAYLFPGPLSTFKALYLNSDILFIHLSSTLQTMVLGMLFGIVFGITLGAMMAALPKLEKTLFPLLFFKQALPSFILAPLIILGFGIGLLSKVIITALAVFFIVLYGTLEGLKNTPPYLQKMADITRGKKRLVFYHLRFKNALPHLKTALKTAAIMAPAATIAGEWVGSTKGLGFIMLNAFDRVENDLMMAALLLCVLLGGFFSAAVHFMLNKLIFWRNL